MRAPWGALTPDTPKLLRACAWAVLILAILVPLPLLFHVLNRRIVWIAAFLPNPQSSWDRL